MKNEKGPQQTKQQKALRAKGRRTSTEALQTSLPFYHIKVMKKSTLFKAVLLILLIGSASYFFVSESVNVKHWINGLCIGLLAGDLIAERKEGGSND